MTAAPDSSAHFDIVTLTANPSLDRTLELPGVLQRGEVQRAAGSRAEPGGKGVNVSRVAAEAGVPTLALLPGRDGDPLLAALNDVGLPYRTMPVDGEIRSNLTIAEPDGTTTKINAPGVALDTDQARRLTELVLEHAASAAWVALCGSLPPGLPYNWYRTLLDALADLPCRVAVDTSGPPLVAAAGGRSDLLKPNDEELAEVTGADSAVLKSAAAAGDLAPIVAAATELSARTGGSVLATLGAAGAVLTTASGSWAAIPPPPVTRITVGAGDSSLAGYVLAALRGEPEPERLRSAVAYGAAAAGLAGTQPPSPAQLDLERVVLTELTPIR